MLKKFSVKNYKNFNELIEIDFSESKNYHFSEKCIKDGTISKLLIYGKNGTGKSNLGEAIMNISSLHHPANFEYFLNADSEAKTTDFTYVYDINNNNINGEIEIKYSLDYQGRISKEVMFLNGKMIYKIDLTAKEFNFDNLKLLEIKTKIHEAYMNQFIDNSIIETDYDENTIRPFYDYLLHNYPTVNNTLIDSLKNEIFKMRFLRSLDRAFMLGAFITERITDDETTKKENLHSLEDFLNFMGVNCKLTLIPSGDGREEIYFDYKKPIPFFRNLSSGTRQLVDLYFRLFYNQKFSQYSFLYIDEFDAYYHYEMAEKILEYIIDNFPNTQVILTTHNTNLMTNSIMRPDCLAILSNKGKLTKLYEATNRELREGHNLEKMYISGEFKDYE